MRIAVVEDDPNDQRILTDCLAQHFRYAASQPEIRCYNHAEDFLADWPSVFDILFLDILMEDCNGIELAKKIREQDERTIIVFVTNTPDYSLDGYSVDACDYILKPITEQRLEGLLRRAEKKQGNLRNAYLPIRNKSGYYMVNTDDILYIDLNGRRITLHMLNEEVSYSGALRALEEQLPASFFHCHSSYIVNMKAIESLHGAQAIVAGKPIPISKHRHKAFLIAFSQYLETTL